MPRNSSRPPATHTKNTHVVQQSPQQSVGFATTMKQGFALGVGQSVAHQVIGSLLRMGSSPTAAAVDCSAYQTCLTKLDKVSCDTLYEQCAKP